MVDEAFTASGARRPHYAPVLDALERAGLGAAASDAAERARAAGLALGGGGVLPVDPVPVVLRAAEWEPLARGLAQRARALDAFVADLYGEQRAVRAGAVPAAALESCVYFEPQLAGVPGVVGVVGFDVVRTPDGFRVLEDNLLTPGHVAAPAARELLPLDAGPVVPRDTREPLRAALRAMLGDGRAAILADGPTFELRWLAELLEVALLTPADVDPRAVDVLWQRTAEDRVRDDAGALTPLGQALLEPVLSGALRVVSRLGCGVGDDKRLGRYLARATRVLLGEELELASVPVLDLAVAGERAAALADPAAHVFKPRNGAGGRFMRFGEAVTGQPGQWIAQRRVELSTHPTVVDDRLEPRRIDLRVFALRTGEGYAVLPGVARFAPSADALVVNTSQGGGIKDVWIVEDP